MLGESATLILLLSVTLAASWSQSRPKIEEGSRARN